MIRKNNISRSIWILVLLFIMNNVGFSQTPTNEWVNFYSDNITYLGDSVPVGSEIKAYDPNGILCGSFVVTTAGEYGLMPVYRDDSTTPEVDEGADPGDTLFFLINGNRADVIGGNVPEWTFNGAVVKIDLEYSTDVISTNEWINCYSDSSTIEGELIKVGMLIDAYDPDGIHCGTFTVQTEGEYGFMPVYRDDSSTPEVDEGADPGDTLTFMINGKKANIMGGNAPLWDFNGSVKKIDLEYITEVIIPDPDEWVYCYGNSSRFENQLIQVGMVIDAYDPDGIHCGTYTVETEGHYGMMSVYRDNPSTPEVDEGVEPGDTIYFKIDGVDAYAYGPDDNVWTVHNDTLNIELNIESLNLRLGLIASHYLLYQNYPNPFNPTTTIQFDLPENSLVNLTIYNSTGREVVKLIQSEFSAGSYEYKWNASSLPSGVYIYKLSANNFTKFNKMILLK